MKFCEHIKSLLSECNFKDAFSICHDKINLYLTHKSDTMIQELYNALIVNSMRFKSVELAADMFHEIGRDEKMKELSQVCVSVLKIIDRLPSDFDNILSQFTYETRIKPQVENMFPDISFENLIAYLPLNNDITDIQSYTSNMEIISFRQNFEPQFIKDNGLFFDGSMILQIENDKLPFGIQPRTFSLWCKLLEVPVNKGKSILETDPPKFIFAYGAEEHGKAFGLFYGIPFFESALKNNFGFRVFSWCHPQLYSLGNKDCDTDEFYKAEQNEWYHITITFENNLITSFINSVKVLEQKRNCFTKKPNSLLNLGGFIPTRELLYSGSEFNFNYVGFIREFMVFDKILTKKEIENLYLHGLKIVKNIN